ncbi:MAG: NADH-quinone oxidoreductase subunit N [Dehalococcoidales bacterium]|nr:NADH-quinone oxidoreductase subunit N [Dehalococcoidales bacterium]
MNPIIFNLEKLPDWFGVLPEIILLVFAALVIILDLFVSQKKILAAVSLIGIIASGALSLGFWGTELSFFNGLILTDSFAVFFKLLFLGVSFLIVLASEDYVNSFRRLQGEYYALLLLATTGMMLMAGAGDITTVYVSLELTGISLYALTGFLKDRKSTEAALKYLLLGAIASAVLLYGLALIFGITGKTGLGEIARAVQAQLSGSASVSPALFLGLVLLIAGFGFKIASIPFHMWVPDVYEGAPTTVTAFLSVASKAAGFAIIMRVITSVFAAPDWLARDWATVFAVLSVLTMTAANIVAIPQSNIKRMLGYSSIAQAGYLMVGLAALGSSPFPGALAGMSPAQSGVLFFLASYAFTNLGAFTAITIIAQKIGSDEIADYAGMGRRSPLLALALTFCLVSLIGIPPASGFMAKFYIFRAAVQADLLWLVIIAVINSVISAYYYLRVVKVMWLESPPSAEKVPSSALPTVSLAVSCLGVLALGTIPGLIMKLAEMVNQFMP